MSAALSIVPANCAGNDVPSLSIEDVHSFIRVRHDSGALALAGLVQVLLPALHPPCAYEPSCASKCVFVRHRHRRGYLVSYWLPVHKMRLRTNRLIVESTCCVGLDDVVMTNSSPCA